MATQKQISAHRKRQRSRSALRRRGGFTLVEMLVAVALVLLLMTLFAQVFQIAGASVSTQRGIMENDQRARSVQTLLKADLDKRTFRYLVPFALNEDMNASEVRAAERRGYFSISENDPSNDTDDVLSLTVDARVREDSVDDTLYYGQALALLPSSLTTAQQYNFYRANANQPERDDGRFDLNGTADSDAAEVTWFVRNGNLYRRVLLLRQPDPTTADDPQPAFASGSGTQRFFSTSMPVYPTDYAGAVNFWRDFDFSAHSSQTGTGGTPPTGFTYAGTVFNGIESLDVLSTIPSVAASQVPTLISYPPNRFGHNYVDLNPVVTAGQPPVGGQPKEYTRTGASGAFVGRFTLEETSDSQFAYPQQSHLSPNCPVSAVLRYAEDTNGNGVLDPGEDANGNTFLDGGLVVAANTGITFTGGPRRGEDLVLANVHAFNIRVYDEVMQAFVDIGHSLPAVGGVIGDYHINNRQNSFYGSNGPNPAGPSSSSGNRVFDTWYPFNTSLPEDTDPMGTPGSLDPGEDQNNNGVLDQLQTLDLDGDGAISDEDADGDGLLDSGEDSIANGLLDHENNPPYRPRSIWPSDTTFSGSRRRLDRWAANFDYNVGDRVFPPLGAQPGDPFYYVCIRAQDGDGMGGTSSRGTAPTFVRIPGLTTEEGNLALGEDQLTWQAVDNRKPLRAIQITLRFLDPTTQQMRTLTIQHGLID